MSVATSPNSDSKRNYHANIAKEPATVKTAVVEASITPLPIALHLGLNQSKEAS